MRQAIEEGFILDFDEDGNITGMEVLDVSRYLNPDELSSVKFDVEQKAAA